MTLLVPALGRWPEKHNPHNPTSDDGNRDGNSADDGRTTEPV